MASTDERWWALLEYGSTEIVIGSGVEQGEGFNATSEGIEGWYSTPEAKWDLTEKGRASGAFRAFDEGELLYAARTVKLSLYAEGTSRDEVVANHLALLGCAGRCCRLTVHDGGVTSYVTGYATVEDAGGALSSARGEVSVTLECPDPYRRADNWIARTAYWWDLSKTATETVPWYMGLSAQQSVWATYGMIYPVIEIEAGEPIEFVRVQVYTTTSTLVADNTEGESIPARHIRIDFRDGTVASETGGDCTGCFPDFAGGTLDTASSTLVTLAVNCAVESSFRYWIYGDAEVDEWL